MKNISPESLVEANTTAFFASTNPKLSEALKALSQKERIPVVERACEYLRTLFKTLNITEKSEEYIEENFDDFWYVFYNRSPPPNPMLYMDDLENDSHNIIYHTNFMDLNYIVAALYELAMYKIDPNEYARCYVIMVLNEVEKGKSLFFKQSPEFNRRCFEFLSTHKFIYIGDSLFKVEGESKKIPISKILHRIAKELKLIKR